MNAVNKAIAGAATTPADVAASALAKRYAHMIEDAETVAQAAALVEPESENDREVLDALRARVDSLRVLSDVGPKLLAVLTELGATPKGRAAVNGKLAPKGGKDDGGSGPRATLHSLRGDAAQRLGGSPG